MHGRLVISLMLCALVSPSAWGQTRKEVIAVFKDGFSMYGKVVEKRDFITDPVSGQSITIPLAGGLINLDDIVRRIYFVPAQLQDILDKKPLEEKLLNLTRYASTVPPNKMLPGWQIMGFPGFNAKWERTLKVHVVRENFDGYFNMDQRIVRLTPQFMHIQTPKYDWDQLYLTQEVGLDEVRALVNAYLTDKKEFKDTKEWDKRKIVDMFLHQAGWHKEAQKDLDDLVEEYPSRTTDLADLRTAIGKILADINVEDCARALKTGQFQKAQALLALYDNEKMATQANQKNQLLSAELRNKIDGLNEKIEQARTTLQAMQKLAAPLDKKFWTDTVDVMLAELNGDTLPRLEAFLTFGQQHMRELEEKTPPSQTAEEVLALAASGWLLGNSSAETDVKNARLLWQVRAMVLEYQMTVNTSARKQMLASVFRGNNLSLDVLARVIKNLPPPYPFDKAKIGTATVPMDIDITDSQGGSYFLRLPPEYHQQRSYPVLLFLHGTNEKPEVLLDRMSALAAQHGFILAAPLWAGKNGKGVYNYTPREHAIVLDTLRDLRRRFQVDSDRVFLFGFSQGGDAALDIGMSHPDQFAGVLSMGGVPRLFTNERDRYQTNAQYLPFYLVEGSRNGINPTANIALFRSWVSGSYPALYTEYKGRGPEWFEAELPRMFEWMSHKKRHYPLKEMGRRHTGGGIGEEFRTMRECDNRFYWLSTDAIDPRNLNSAAGWVPTIPPATMLANISIVNELIVNSGGQKEAKIITQFNIQAKGLRQLTLWLAPNMVDFTKPIRIRVNGATISNDRVIPPNPTVLMEDFYYTGDRQRLFYAKVDMKF